MKICDVVLNSIWYDPRVIKQLDEYKKYFEVYAVGIKCARYDEEKVNSIGCNIRLCDVEKPSANILKRVLSELKMYHGVYKLIIKTKPDIIHANDLNALIPAYYAAKKLKCKLIYDTHEIFLENIGVKDKKIVRKGYGFFEKKIIKKCDLVVSVSNAAAGYLSDFYNIKKPLVVTNCISKDRIITDVLEKNDGFEVLCHGQYYAGRGYDLLLKCAKIMKSNKDVNFCVRGFGRLEMEMRNYVESNQLNNFIFYPPVTVQELIPKASLSMVGVAITEPINLNFKLSVSNKLFEYAAAGLPVIMSDIPEHRYLNDKYHFGIILENNTPEEICKAVEKLYADKEFYNKCAENAIKLAREINWENEFEKLVRIERTWVNG